VRKRLGIVTKVASVARIELLGIEPEWAGVPDQALAQLPGRLQFADLDEGGDEQERADHKCSLLPAKAIIRVLDAVAQNQSSLSQLACDRKHGVSDPLVASGQESKQGHRQK